MTASNTRLMKEARAMFWPWCAVVMVALVSPLATQLNSFVLGEADIIGFYLGIPLLAVIAFGNEFQHRTASLLLAQPVDRAQIWREKLTVTLAAAVSASLVYYLVSRPTFERNPYDWVFAAAFFTTIVGSATFWVLIARTTAGAVVLNIAVQGLIVGGGFGLGQFILASSRSLAAAFSISAFGLLVAIGYATLMLWLGRRKLIRFQVAGEIGGHDLLSAQHHAMTAPLTRPFHWQRNSPTLHLIRKEMRFLRPIWTLTAGVAATLLVLSRLMPLFSPDTRTLVTLAGDVALLMHLMLATVLAGSLSMGEERQLGTHSFNLTSPGPLPLQWLIKFLSAVSASLASAVVVVVAAYPIIAPQFPSYLHTGVQAFLRDRDTVNLFALVLAATLVAFWCACAVDGTIRAASWTLPLVFAVTTAASAGGALPYIEPFREVLGQVVLKMHPFPLSPRLEAIADWNYSNTPLVLIPTAALAIFQSYQFFKRERQESSQSIFRRLISLCGIAFLCAFLPDALNSYVRVIYSQQSTTINEVTAAVQRLQVDTAQLDAGHSIPVSLEDLSKVYPLSRISRAWLPATSISIYPMPAKPIPCSWRKARCEMPRAAYAARLLLGDLDCRFIGDFRFCWSVHYVMQFRSAEYQNLFSEVPSAEPKGQQ